VNVFLLKSKENLTGEWWRERLET